MKCTIESCNRPVYNKTLMLCSRCNQRRLRSRDYEPSEEELRIRFKEQVAISDDPTKCWEAKRNINTSGYGKMSISSKVFFAHRVALRLASGKWPLQWVLHTCGNRLCCNPNHLYEGTPKQNAEDRDKDGTQLRGEQIWNAKLTVPQVRTIKALLNEGVAATRLARLCNVSAKAIKQIRDGASWKHVKPRKNS